GAADQEAGREAGEDDPGRRPARAPGGLERVRAHACLQRAAFDQLFATLDAAADRVELHGAPACVAGAWAASPPASSSSSFSSPIPKRASWRRVACMPAWSKNTDTRHAAKPVTPRLSA